MLRLHASVFVSLLPIVAIATASCGGKVGEQVRPKDFTASGALGTTAATCTGDAKLANPLIVDLDADARVDLEASLKGPVIVVAYDCNTLRVLPNCKVSDAKYDYRGVSKKEVVVQIKGADDLAVNLPLSAGKLGGEIQSGRTIDLGLVYVGRQTTVVAEAKREDLKGKCEGATHYLQRATVGAFAMSTGSMGKATMVADLFKVGASGSSESSHKGLSNDGSLEDCRKADVDAEKPPGECRSPLRVELMPIIGKEVAKTPAGSETAEAPPPPAAAEHEEKPENAPKQTADENPCRPGYVLTGEICTKAGGTAAEEGGYLCERSKQDECKAQCAKGSAGSCFNYGLAHMSLGDRSKRTDDPTPYLQKACDKEHAEGCSWLGWELVSDGAPPEKAHEALKKACGLGSGDGCVTLADLQRNAKVAATYDMAAAFKSLDRGCGLGAPTACARTAWAYVKGEGVPKDPQKGVDFFAKACTSGDHMVCRNFAEALDQGKDGFPKDGERAIKILKDLCNNDPDPVYRSGSCEQLADTLVAHGHYEDAFQYATLACNMVNGGGCDPLLRMYESGKGTKKDPAKAKALRAKLCDPNSALIALDMLRDKPICGKPKAAKAPGKGGGKKK